MAEDLSFVCETKDWLSQTNFSIQGENPQPLSPNPQHFNRFVQKQLSKVNSKRNDAKNPLLQAELLLKETKKVSNELAGCKEFQHFEDSSKYTEKLSNFIEEKKKWNSKEILNVYKKKFPKIKSNFPQI